MSRYFKILFLITFLTLSLSGCFEPVDNEQEKWAEIEKSARTTEVKLAYESDIDFESFLDGKFRSNLLENKNIKLKTYKTKIKRIDTDKEQIKDNPFNGDYDILIVTQESFDELNKKEFLYGPFVDKIPNYREHISKEDYCATHIEFNPIEGKAIPFYQSQLSFFYNADTVLTPPQNLDELKEYVKENPYKFLYPHPDTKEGKLFLQSLIYEFTSEEDFMEENLDSEQILELILPAFRYLNEIKPYMYGRGRIHSKRMESMDTLFFDTDISFVMSLDPYHAENKLIDMNYPDYTRPFSPFNSSASSVEYYAVIPVDSANKSGAMVVLNEYLSPNMQAMAYKDKNLHSFSVYSKSKLDKAVKLKLDDKVKKNALPKPSLLLERKKRTIPEKYWKMILKEWKRFF